jgi:ADP-ribosyl-[dinitrogen reductase] hydrolase
MSAADAALDRSLGAFLGLAVGDALGASVEGQPRDSYPRVTDYAPSTFHGLSPGEWTDDTAMALCLADSLLACRPFDAGDLLARFVRWLRLGENAARGEAVGISERTRATLEVFEITGRQDAAREVMNPGNGCIMRLAPVAILHRADLAEARRVARAQALTTHAAEEALGATAALTEILVAALSGSDVAAHPVLRAVRAKSRDEISSAPRAVDTLEAALWCVARAADFEEAIIAAVNLGGDTDTIGAVAGQVAGAVFGASAIPRRWREALHAAARIEELALELHRRVGLTGASFASK